MALILSIVDGASAPHAAGISVDACKRESMPAELSNHAAEIVGQHWDNLIGDCAEVFERANLYTTYVPYTAGLVAVVGFILAFTQCPCKTQADGSCGYDPSDCNTLGLVGTISGPAFVIAALIWFLYFEGTFNCAPVFLIRDFDDCQRRWDEQLQGASFTCRVHGDKPNSNYSPRWFEITFEPAVGAATATPGSLQLAA